MREEYLFALLFLISWLVAYLLSKILPLKRYGLHVKPFFIRYESEGFRRILYKYSNRWIPLWKIFSYLSVFSGFGLTLFSLIFLSGNLVEIFLQSGRGAAITPVIPGLTLSLYWLPYFLIAVIVAVFTHEAAHGVLALVDGASIKSAGVLILAIFPGGFVELDERELERMPRESKLKIFSAGSASNVLGGMLIFLLTLCFFVQTPSGIVVLNILEGGPLDLAGIERWDVIYALNGTPIRTYQDLAAFMANVRPGERLTVSTSKGNITVTTISSPENKERAIIGIVSPFLLYYPSRLGLGFFWDVQLYLTLNWLFLVLVNIALFNMLPIPLLDGDRFLQCLLEKFAEKGDAVKKFFNLLSIFLLVANMALSL